MIRLMPLLLLFSCSFGNIKYIHEEEFVPSKWETVKIYAGVGSSKYEELGPVWYDSHQSMEHATRGIKKIAAKRGANAIIKTRLYHISTTGRIGIKGIAIKYVR
jgi:uncharacterized protein YbjQ (UPF0145 family)